jgi:predicted metalloendopeptidase
LVHELTHIWQDQSGTYDENTKTWLGTDDDVDYTNRAREIHARFTAGLLNARREVRQGLLSKEKFEKYFKPEHSDPEWALKRSLKKRN